jgi:outer membrane protein OmpA-like peptidoglycan-associated protein
MNIKTCLVVLFLLRVIPSFGQEIDTVRLFFGINESQLSDDNQHKLDAYGRWLKYYPRINIIGYADYLGDDPKNFLLSVNRAEAAKAYLLCLSKYPIITTEGKGTVPAQQKNGPYGEPMSRRIDIILRTRPGIRLPQTPPQTGEKRAEDAPPVNITEFNNKLNSLTNMRAGNSILLQELNFPPGQHFLTPESDYYIKVLLAYLKKNDKLFFEIRGHICCDYNHPDAFDIDTHEYGLSLSRAKFIYDYLSKNGIAKKRMHYTGVGSSKPEVYPEYTEYDRAVNRRVEILIVDNKGIK